MTGVSDFEQVVETYLSGAATSSATEIFSKNPLLSINDGTVRYKYDFLSSYFLSLWLIERLESGAFNELFVKHLARYQTGQGSVFEDLSRFYAARPKRDVQERIAATYLSLKGQALAVEEIAGSSAYAKAACSTLLQLFAVTAGKGMARGQFSDAVFAIVGEEMSGGRRITRGLLICGDFPILHFVNRELWNCHMIGYDSFARCRFSNAKFFYSTFIAINADNRSPTMSAEVFDLQTCDLGDLANSLSIDGAPIHVHS